MTQKISAHTTLTTAQFLGLGASSGFVEVLDVADTTESVNGTLKRFRPAGLMPQVYSFTPVPRATGTSDWAYGTGGSAGAIGILYVVPLASGLFRCEVDVSIRLGTTGVSGGDGTWIVQGIPAVDALFPMETNAASSDNIGTAVFVNNSGGAGRAHYIGGVALDSDLATLPRMAADVNHVFVPLMGAPFGNAVTEYISSITPYNSSTATEWPWDAVTGAEGWGAADQMRFNLPFMAAATSDFSGLTVYTG